MKSVLVFFAIAISVSATAQNTKKFQSKEYGHSFSISKNYKLSGDTLKPDYSNMIFTNGKRAQIIIAPVNPAGYDSAAVVNALPQMAALTPADWAVQLPKSYPGAKFKEFKLLDIGKRPAYRLDFEIGEGDNKMNYAMVCIYTKKRIYNVQMLFTEINMAAALNIYQDQSDFSNLLNSFMIK
jgi:hypothetical protein